MALKCILFLIAIHSQIVNYFGKSVFLAVFFLVPRSLTGDNWLSKKKCGKVGA